MNAKERVLLTPAYVLHQHDWHETSRLVEIFSRDHGRLGAVARGARRAKSPWRALLRPFQPLLLSWMGNGELVTLVGAEAYGAPHLLSGRVLMSGFYMNELLLRLLPRKDPQLELFPQYGAALDLLAQATNTALRLFEKHLLTALGYGLNLEWDAASAQPVKAEALYRYELERGPVHTTSAAGSAIYIHGGTLLALAAENLNDSAQLREAYRLLRAVLDQLLEGRPLRTRMVMRTLGKLAV